MASSNGKAIEAPAPLSSVRRDKCFRLRNIPTILQWRAAHDAAHGGHVAIVNAATKRISQKIFGECLNEPIRPCDERPAQICRSFDGSAVGKSPGRVDRG